MYKAILLKSIVLNTVFESYLLKRQFLALFTDSENEESRAYNRDKLIFQFVSVIFNSCIGYYTYSTDFLISYFEVFSVYCTVYNPLLVQTLFSVSYNLLGLLIAIPLSLINTFIIEARHGFNNTTLKIYITDLLKSILLMSSIGSLCCYFTLVLVQKFIDKNFALPVFVFLFGVQLLLYILTPLVILPLFNKFEQLKECELKVKIEELSGKLKFPLKNIYSMDGSKRSGHSNAFFIGLFGGPKKIVLYDTLIEQLSESEILAVLWHEIGHWYYSHILKALMTSLLIQGFGLYALQKFMQDPEIIADLFGKFTEVPLIIRMLYISSVIGVVSPPIMFMMNYLTRKREREADAYAVKCGYGEELICALKVLEKENKGVRKPDILYSILHYSHPPVSERESSIRKLMDKIK